MRKKFTDETYLRGVSKYTVTTKKLKGQDTYIVVKNIQEIDEPFIRNATLIDNGYYIVEYTPMDKLYNARAFVDNELKTISYYFDISLGNGLENGRRPFYDDLFLDIVYGTDTDKNIKVLDEDELLDALEKGIITKKEFDLAHSVCSELVNEIRENRNAFVNMNKKEIIRHTQILEVDERSRQIDYKLYL